MSIGKFISELRHESGMTQQELADRLNVSNKAISRWERDEAMPDITLLPVIAEIFGVTCDELLNGRRTEKGYAPPEMPRASAANALLKRAVSAFKTKIIIAFALSLAGFILMLGIVYGFFAPLVGFAVMLIFEIAAAVITLISVNRLREIKDEGSALNGADEKHLKRLDGTLINYSYCAFFAVFTAVLFSLAPMQFIFIDVKAVTEFSIYVRTLPISALISFLVFILFKEPYRRLLTGEKIINFARPDGKVRKMNIIQWCALLAAGALFIAAPSFDNLQYKVSVITTVMQALGLAMLLAVIIIFVVFFIKEKAERRNIAFYGTRNIFMIIPCFLLSYAHDVGFYEFEEGISQRYDNWNIYTILTALAIALIIAAVWYAGRNIVNSVLKRREKAE